MRNKILIGIVSVSVILSLILIGILLVDGFKVDNKINSTTKTNVSTSTSKSTVTSLYTPSTIVSSKVTLNSTNTTTTTGKKTSTTKTTTRTTTTTTSFVDYNKDSEFLFYPEKDVYDSSITQVNFVLRRRDGAEFTYGQRYFLYYKDGNEWVSVPTVDQSGTYKPLAYRSIFKDDLGYAKGIVFIRFNKYNFDFVEGEYKVILDHWDGELTGYFKIVD